MQNEFFETNNKTQHLLKKNLDHNANNDTINPENFDEKNIVEKDNLFSNQEKKISPNLQNEKNEDDDYNFNIYFFIKSCLVVLSITLISLNTVYGFALPHSNVRCFDDKVFVATEKLNKYFNNNPQSRHFLIIFSSFCVDFSVLYMCFVWCLYGKSWRIFTSTLLFYLLRGFIQSIFQMSYPEGYIWEYPGFPSLMVSYLKTNDFFYSGHVGLPVILMSEFYVLKRFNMFGFCLFTFFFEAFTMIATRGHYSIDLITGAIFAHYIFQNVEKNIHHIDSLTIGNSENHSKWNNCKEVNNNEKKTETNALNSEFNPVPIKYEV